MEKTRKILLFLLAVGLILRLALMPFTLHGDLLYIHSNAQYFSLGVFDIYSFLSEKNSCFGIEKSCYGYSPVSYWLVGFFDSILQFLNPAFFQWMQSVVSIALSGNSSVLNYFLAFPANGSVFLTIFLMKLPYLLFDLGTAFLLLKFFEAEREKIFAFAFWMLNPVSIFAPFVLGQFDVIAVFFMVFGFYFLSKKFFSKSMLSFGLAIALKVFPLVVLLPVVLISFSSFYGRIKNLAIAAVPSLLSFLPFVFSSVFWQSFLFAGIQATGNYAFYTISGLVARIMGVIGISLDYHFLDISVFSILYVLLLLFVYLKFADLEKNFFENSLNFGFAVLLLFFAFSEFSPHWFLWIMPFFAIFLAGNRQMLKYYFLLLLFYAVIVLNFGQNLSWNLLIPANPLFAEFPSAAQWIGSGWKAVYAVSRICFAAICMFFALKAIRFNYKFFIQKNCSRS